jgi:peptidoglycan/LPS O-acetylase OafA/YrhL
VSERERRALRFQAGYYAVTGIWPILSMRSFEAVTGPKRDRWLVRMVGLLAATIGASILVGLQDEEVSAETRALAICSAASFAAIDTVYALPGRISKIYLADAAVELAIIVSLLRHEGP